MKKDSRELKIFKEILKMTVYPEHTELAYMTNSMAESLVDLRNYLKTQFKTKGKKDSLLSAAYCKLIEGHSEEEIKKACDCDEYHKCTLCVARDILDHLTKEKRP